ncbi:MAG: hypothetical protein HY711_09730, partial [Candidatus Melainabacteria bacterium]|nr:hypothetical protein [Candidatus Melainabacteria bacterium]
SAQIDGTFAPSVYGDVPSAPLPQRLQIPYEVSLFKRKALELQSSLRERQRPYFAQVFSYANEPLNDFDGRLDTITASGEFGFFPNSQTHVQLAFLPSVLGLKRPSIFGHEYRATVWSQPSDRLKYYLSTGLFHTFHKVHPGVAFVGGGGATYALNDRLRANIEYRRDIVGDSRLSAVGLNLPGTDELVGRVKRNRLSIGASVRPTAKTNIDFRYGIGFDAGHKVPTNPFNEFSLRIGRTLIAREPGTHLQWLQPSYQFLATGFKKDLSSFGNLSFIPDGTAAGNLTRVRLAAAGEPTVPTLPYQKVQGVGGYFSPQIFYLNALRLDTYGRLLGAINYKLGGSIGTQDFKNMSQSLGHISLVGTANASLSMRLSRNVTVEHGWLFLQAANAYQRNIIYTQTRYYF